MKYVVIHKMRWATPTLYGGRPKVYEKGEEISLPDSVVPPPHSVYGEDAKDGKHKQGDRTPGTRKPQAAAQALSKRAPSPMA